MTTEIFEIRICRTLIRASFRAQTFWHCEKNTPSIDYFQPRKLRNLE